MVAHHVAEGDAPETQRRLLAAARDVHKMTAGASQREAPAERAAEDLEGHGEKRTDSVERLDVPVMSVAGGEQAGHTLDVAHGEPGGQGQDRAQPAP